MLAENLRNDATLLCTESVRRPRDRNAQHFVVGDAQMDEESPEGGAVPIISRSTVASCCLRCNPRTEQNLFLVDVRDKKSPRHRTSPSPSFNYVSVKVSLRYCTVKTKAARGCGRSHVNSVAIRAICPCLYPCDVRTEMFSGPWGPLNLQPS